MQHESLHHLFYSGLEGEAPKIHTFCSCGWRGHNHSGTDAYRKAGEDFDQHLKPDATVIR